MKEIILLKSGEIMMKGLNRSTFEDKLMSNARKALKPIGKFKVYRAQSTFYAEPLEEGIDIDIDLALEALGRVFGFSALSKSLVVEKDFAIIALAAVDYLRDILSVGKTFKVNAKRSDKSFPLNSPEISRKLGGIILDAFPNLSVDVHKPEIQVVIEVRDFGAYIHEQQRPGAGGMPVGTGGKGVLLLSGGIDSPVAGYMLAKRGLEIIAVHFESPPYTSPHALEKVEMLCRKMAKWSGAVKLYTVPFTQPQEAMKRSVPEQYITLVMRRLMMRISERIAEENDGGALITGESVGQVASQTLKAIASTDSVVRKTPVLRPVIGMDKEEIVVIARKIDTYETSILPYEDCCTVFTPKRPKTNPTIEEVDVAEASLDVEGIVDKAVEEARWKMIG